MKGMYSMTTKPFKAKEIHFIDGNILFDKVGFITSGLLIVANDENDDKPTWYNLNELCKMVEVMEIKPTTKNIYGF